VPPLVQVVSGNPATSAAVLLCLNTYDVTIVRQLHPVLLHTVAGVPWCDMAATVHDVRRWRDALPAAVGAKVVQLFPDTLALLAGLMALDIQECDAVTDVVVQRLPPRLRHLNVRLCRNLTRAVSFTSLSSLTSLNCSITKALDEGLGALPPSLQELRMNCCKDATLPAANFRALLALRVLSWSYGGAEAVSTATLPPTLEVLDIRHSGAAVPADSSQATMSLAHLPQLRAFCAAYSPIIDDATVAALPSTSLVELDIMCCKALTPAVSFAHLRALRTLNASGTKIEDACLASLPPSLVSLHIAMCKQLSPSTILPDLPALQKLDASGTSIGDAFVASLPRSLIKLRIANCVNVTPAADARHLTALQKLHCSGTNLSLSTIAALRTGGCFAPAESVLTDPAINVPSMEVLADGRLVTVDWEGTVRLSATTRDGAVAARTVLPVLETERATTLAVLPDGRRLAVVMYTHTANGTKCSIDVWDTATTPPTKCTSIACAGFRVFVLGELRDGRLAAGCDDGRIRLVDVDGGTVGGDPSLRHGQSVTVLAVLPDGTLASGAHDATVRVWNVGSGVCAAVLTGHQRPVRALASGHLASAGEDYRYAVRLWDAATWTCFAAFTTVGEYRYGHMPMTYAMAALPDGRLACGDSHGVIRVWDTHTCSPLRDGDAATRQRSAASHCVNKVELKGHTDIVATMALLPHGRLVSSGWGDPTIRLWRLPPLPGAV